MLLGRPPAHRPARGALALGLAVSLASGGCSFIWMRPPPHREDWPEQVRPETSEARCTVSLGPPVLDTVTFGILGTLAYVERNAITYDPSPTRGGQPVPVPDHLARGIAAAFAVGALASAASAVYGYVNDSRCRRYKALFHPPLE
jgi:hypothetical protein